MSQTPSPGAALFGSCGFWVLALIGSIIWAFMGHFSTENQKGAPAKEPVEDGTVVVQFFAPGNAMDASVTWPGDGTRQSYRGELPLMNTGGSQGVAYRVPAGTRVSMTVVNHGSDGGTHLGFAGSVACRIEVDGYSKVSKSEKGYHSSVTCAVVAE